MNCRSCGKPIPQARLDAIPGVETCVGCSDEPETIGFMMYAHKTAGEVQILRRPSPEQRRRARREYRRSR